MAEYVRTGQWKIMHSTYDRWGPFCEAAARYEHKLQANVQIVLPKLHSVALSAAVAKRRRRCKAPVATPADSSDGVHGSSAPAALALLSEPEGGKLTQVLQYDAQVAEPLSAPPDVASSFGAGRRAINTIS